MRANRGVWRPLRLLTLLVRSYERPGAAGCAPEAAAPTHGRMYGMEKTPVCLTEPLKAARERTAEAEKRSEADLIREGVALVVERHALREPTLPLFESRQPNLAEHADEALEGFGER